MYKSPGGNLCVVNVAFYDYLVARQGKGGGWEVVAFQGTDQSGLTCLILRTFPTQEEAESCLRELMARLALETVVDITEVLGNA